MASTTNRARLVRAVQGATWKRSLRRPQRLLKRKQLPFAWDRLDAVNGRNLSWDELERDGIVLPEAIKEARYAEREGMPTICRRTGSFSPHLTLSAVGVACSHRKVCARRQSRICLLVFCL